MPRPSDRPTGQVWALLEAWAGDHPMQPNQRQIAKLLGISTSLLSNWKYMDSAMQTPDALNVCEQTGIAYDELAAAVAADSPSVVAANAARRPGRKGSLDSE